MHTPPPPSPRLQTVEHLRVGKEHRNFVQQLHAVLEGGVKEQRPDANDAHPDKQHCIAQWHRGAGRVALPRPAKSANDEAQIRQRVPYIKTREEKRVSGG